MGFAKNKMSGFVLGLWARRSSIVSGGFVVSGVWYFVVLYNVSEALGCFRRGGCVSFACNKSYVGHDGAFVMI